jgi:hypothetical protein
MSTYQPNIQDFDDQGHRPDQRESAEKIGGIAIVAIVICCFIAVIMKICEIL